MYQIAGFFANVGYALCQAWEAVAANPVAQIVANLFIKNGLVMSFLIVGIISLIADFIAAKVTRGRIHASAIAIFFGLILAYVGGYFTGGEKGIADLPMFAGIGLLGGSSLRDFAIVATSYGAKFSEIKKSGLVGIISLFIGVIMSFAVGSIVAFAFGYHNAKDMATIGAGAATFVVGPVTGAALGVDSTVITISVAVGLIKSIAVMLFTPLVAKRIGLTTPRAAMVFGGLVGTTSGTTAGLAATDASLVPYGAMTSTFYTGLGCLLCPSVLYYLLELVF